MKNRNPRTVKILDDWRPIFQCRLCHQIWWPSIRPDSGGRFYRGSWQCPNACKA